jgi:DNA (cytosine-5)-methyltransferase 1
MNTEPLTVGSLFSGIGGLDLGLERAGMKVIWQSEIEPYASRVLAKHWPEVPNYGDIKEINWDTIPRPDVICGGYPCQPFSTAGKRKGEQDPRHLWPWVREAISELRPRYAILENVRGHLSLGGVTVIGELAAIGYDAEWRIVSAASVGANHRRDRIIIVAYPNSLTDIHNKREWQCANFTRCSNDDTTRPKNTYNNKRILGNKKMDETTREIFGGHTQKIWSPPQWESEPDILRMAHGIPYRVDRLRGLGNAVVPQVAEVIGRLVVKHAKETQQ